MRKLLVSGCSFSSGWGFTDANIQRNWPTQLAKRLDATVTNVAQLGFDNPGIFINFIEQLTKEDFDICLLQVTSIDRLLLSPNWHAATTPRIEENMTNGLMSDSEYKQWCSKFLLLNQQSEHWIRLTKIINVIQNLSRQGKYIRFVNGLLDWDRELFIDPLKSGFLERLIDIDNIPNDEIDRLRNLVYNQTKGIDLNLWINPFDSFHNLQIDDMSPETDPYGHPGVESHDMYAELVFNYLKDDKNA
jgi:hypothetical protein